VALLAEVDARRLYLGQGYASLFAWCIDVLHLSEPAAYSRIAAARVARRYPMIVTLLRDGDLTLTTVTLLAAHLTDENHEALLEAARHASKRDVERMVASLVPQPAIASTLRRLPSPPASPVLLDVPFPPPPVADHDGGFAPDAPVRQEPGASKDCSERQPASAAPQNGAHAGGTGSVAPPRGVVAPLGPDRYLLKITLSASAHARLERARDLLRHVVPSGDPAAIVDRALSVLVDELEKSRCAAAHRPPARPRATSTPRHVPAAVRRAVWTRDEGRCAFVGATGRCRETGWLELHHRVPCARGGPASVENIELRCRAHNAYEAEREFGARVPARRGRSARVTTTLAGQSPPGDVAARSSGQSRSRRDP
jgi:5-methylcytosine-specific restriction endonuclease McrA